MKPSNDEPKPSQPKPNPELVENWPDAKLFAYSGEDLLKLEPEFPDAVIAIRMEQLKRAGVPWEKAKLELKAMIARQRGSKPSEPASKQSSTTKVH